jgi:hypothetical protein
MHYLREQRWVKGTTFPPGQLAASLQKKGWIEQQRQGPKNETFYRITDAGLAALKAPVPKKWVTAMRAYAAKAKATDARKVRAAQLPSNKGFFIFMACCATGAVAMIALLVAGEIKGARVAPDIEHEAKIFD